MLRHPCHPEGAHNYQGRGPLRRNPSQSLDKICSDVKKYLNVVMLR